MKIVRPLDVGESLIICLHSSLDLLPSNRNGIAWKTLLNASADRSRDIRNLEKTTIFSVGFLLIWCVYTQHSALLLSDISPFSVRFLIFCFHARHASCLVTMPSGSSSSSCSSTNASSASSSLGTCAMSGSYSLSRSFSSTMPTGGRCFHVLPEPSGPFGPNRHCFVRSKCLLEASQVCSHSPLDQLR